MACNMPHKYDDSNYEKVKNSYENGGAGLSYKCTYLPKSRDNRDILKRLKLLKSITLISRAAR